MELRHYVVLSVLGVVACGAASAKVRGINTDGWQSVMNPATETNTWNGSSVTETSASALPDGSFLPDGVTLSFSTGNSVDTYDVLTQSPGSGTDLFQWENATTDEAVTYTSTGADSFTIDMEYADISCAGETGTLQVNTLTFKAANPCTLGTEMIGVGASSGNAYDYFDSQFTFDVTSNGKVELVGQSPWAAASAAPEIDAKSAMGGLTLLLGSIAVARGRRRSFGVLVKNY